MSDTTNVTKKVIQIAGFPTRVAHPEHGEILIVDATQTHAYGKWYYAYVVPGEDDGGLIRDNTTEVAILEEPLDE
jgi:hypothetical protein